MKAATSCENKYINHNKNQISTNGMNFCMCYGHFRLNISTSAANIGLKMFYVKRQLTCDANRPAANKGSCDSSINSNQTTRPCILEDNRMILLTFTVRHCIHPKSEIFPDKHRYLLNLYSVLNSCLCLSQGLSFQCWKKNSPTTWRTFCYPWSTRWCIRVKRAASCLPVATLQVLTALDNSVQARDRTRDLPHPCRTQFIHIRWGLVHTSLRESALHGVVQHEGEWQTENIQCTVAAVGEGESCGYALSLNVVSITLKTICFYSAKRH
jgi:hypothetical protein